MKTLNTQRRAMKVTRSVATVLTLIVGATDGVARGALGEAETYDASTAHIIRAAKASFPLRLLTIHRLPQQNGTTIYAVRLDARHVPGAPAATITCFISIGQGASIAVIDRTMRDASAQIATLIRQAVEQHNGGVGDVRPDLIAPSDTAQ